MDTAAAGSDGYTLATKIRIDGTELDSVGVRFKGNSSYRANNAKNPLHISLDKFKKKNDYQGLTDFKLSNAYKDPTFAREMTGYHVLSYYMETPRSNYAQVYINGQLYGLFVNDENIDASFLKHHYNSSNHVFFKCNPPAGAGPGSTAKPNLTYLGADSSAYYASYDINSDYGWGELMHLCDTLVNYPDQLNNLISVNEVLWMLAFNSITVNLDSYSGGFSQNYYLYRDHKGQFHPVVWDLNESFGGFGMTGTTNLQNITQKQQLVPFLHSNDSDWPLIQKVFANAQWKKMYVAHLNTMLNEQFASGDYYTYAQHVQSICDTAVQSDPGKFYTYNDFSKGMTSSTGSGMQSINGITELMTSRITYLSQLASLTKTPPVIVSVTHANSQPLMNTSEGLYVKTTGATACYVMYRYNHWDPYIWQAMYDDRTHGDAAAGDGVFSFEIPLHSSRLEYYTWAENNDAGVFYPVRAGKEFLTISATAETLQPGDMVINEIMPVNAGQFVCSLTSYPDWIELHNTTSKYLDIGGYYLSDKSSKPTKWSFPEQTVVNPNSYLLVWADEDTKDAWVHAEFKLAASGESVLFSAPDGTLIEQVDFPQLSSDGLTYGRYPNATGPFQELWPTPEAPNGAAGIDKMPLRCNGLSVYPNPASDVVTIQTTDSGLGNIAVLNTQGQVVWQGVLTSPTANISLSDLVPGVYVIRVGGQNVKLIHY